MFRTLSRHWWWDGMYGDVVQQVKCCTECAIVCGGGKVGLPPLYPIPVQRPFQILAVDIMDLPATTQGNKHVIVFQDYLTKWPMVYAIPDQKAQRIARILVEEIVPFLVFQRHSSLTVEPISSLISCWMCVNSSVSRS